MLKLLSTKTSALLYGTSVARIRFDLYGGITSRTHRLLQLVSLHMFYYLLRYCLLFRQMRIMAFCRLVMQILASFYISNVVSYTIYRVVITMPLMSHAICISKLRKFSSHSHT